MNTKQIIIIGLVALIAVLVITREFNVQGPDNPPANGTPNNSIGDTGQSYVDLDNMYSDFISETNIAENCLLAGGQWVSTWNRVGCFNTLIAFDPAIVCTTPTIQATTAMCQAAHGIAVCDGHNLGCYYS